MKKRVLALFLGMTMMATLVGCSDGKLSDERIVINKYKGLEVEYTEFEITDAEVDMSIESSMEAMELGKVKNVKGRGAEKGDTITVDYVGKIDGKEMENGSAKDSSWKLGYGYFIDGFEDGIVGHKKGDVFDLNLKFPEDYQATEIAGKDVVFTITLKKIQYTEYPKLTDKVATQLAGNETTVDAYRKQVKEDLEKANEETLQAMLEQNVWQALIEECVVEAYLETDLEAKKKEVETRYTSMASYYGMEVDAFVEQYYGVSMDEMAKNLLKQDYAIELIAKKEKFEVTDEEYQKGLKEYAVESGYDAEDEEKLKEFEDMVTKSAVKKMLLQEEVTKLLIENCVKVEPKETAETETK